MQMWWRALGYASALAPRVFRANLSNDSSISLPGSDAGAVDSGLFRFYPIPLPSDQVSVFISLRVVLLRTIQISSGFLLAMPPLSCKFPLAQSVFFFLALAVPLLYSGLVSPDIHCDLWSLKGFRGTRKFRP